MINGVHTPTSQCAGTWPRCIQADVESNAPVLRVAPKERVALTDHFLADGIQVPRCCETGGGPISNFLASHRYKLGITHESTRVMSF